MAITFVATSSSTPTANNTVTVNKPAGTLDGHIMVAFLYVEDSTSGLLPGNTPPLGWTQLLDMYVNTVGQQQHTLVFWKRASTEGANYTWSWTTGVWNEVIIGTYSGCIAAGNAIDASASGSITTLSTCNAPSVTATQSDDMWLSCVSHWQTGASTAPATWTKRAELNDTLAYAEKQLSSTGATGTAQWSGLPSPFSNIASSVLLLAPAPVVVSKPPIYQITGLNQATGLYQGILN